MSVVAIAKHPKTEELSFDIVKVVEKGTTYYYFDEDGDWYCYINSVDPLTECMEDAMKVLNQMYNGTYYDNSIDQESLTFNAMQS